MMEELVALKPAQGRHRAHPEMVRPDDDGVERLFETDRDFKTQGVEPDDLRRREREVGGQEQELAALGMNAGDETDESAGRAPEQVATSPVQRDVLLIVERARHRRQGPGEEIAQPDFGAVKSGPAGTV